MSMYLDILRHNSIILTILLFSIVFYLRQLLRHPSSWPTWLVSGIFYRRFQTARAFRTHATQRNLGQGSGIWTPRVGEQGTRLDECFPRMGRWVLLRTLYMTMCCIISKAYLYTDNDHRGTCLSFLVTWVTQVTYCYGLASVVVGRPFCVIP